MLGDRIITGAVIIDFFAGALFNSLGPGDAIWLALEILVNTGSGNGSLPDGTKRLPEPMLTYHQ